MMSVNPEQWFDDNKAAMPEGVVANFERLRIYLRGWQLFQEIHEQLANDMITHACSKVDDPDQVPLLTETLRTCADYYILMLCGEVEALLKHSEDNLQTDLIDDEIIKRNKLFDTALNQEGAEGSKGLLQETLDIFQKAFLSNKKQLLNIESKWWRFYKYSFQFHSMTWHVDAYKIVLELRKGKRPDELFHLTHQKDFEAVKDLVETIEQVANENQ
jgi:hypothetical protein